MSQRRAFWLSCGVLALLVLLFFYRLAWTNGILARGDTYVYFYPYWDARDAALSEGRLPLWSPYIFMGAPLLANPQLGTFYPLNWLTISLPAPDAIRYSILLHVYWAALGTYLLALRVVRVGHRAAILGAAIFAFGGYLTAHIEQINQLQGLSWLPWLLLLAIALLQKPRLYLWLLFGGLLAIQLFTGHTQTVFITLVTIAVYSLVFIIQQRQHRMYLSARMMALVAVGGVVALLLAVPQLIPTLELTGLSIRSGGLTPNEATAFSLSPLMLGRGLLPSYDAQIFGEYVAYAGIIGLGLAIVGGVTGQQKRWRWVLIAAVGLFLAMGAYTPLYWPLASLPGFNLFRVPSRFLALTVLGVAMLAAMGMQAVFNGYRPSWRVSAALLVLIGGLGLGAWLGAQLGQQSGIFPPEAIIEGEAIPQVQTFLLWGVFALLCVALWRWRHGAMILAVLTIVELFLAAQVQPFHDLTPPDVYEGQRFTISQMRAFVEAQTLSGRMLAISGLFFETGDKAELTARFIRDGMDDLARKNAFVAIKRQELLFPNLGLRWHIPTVDGFGGGILPTIYYSQFTSLMLPPNTLRTVDGRLGERLALPACRWACLPDGRWLTMTDTRYLIVDKVADVWHNAIAFDMALPVLLDAEPFSMDSSQRTATTRPFYPAPTDFGGDTLYILFDGISSPVISALADVTPITADDVETLDDGLQIARYTLDVPGQWGEYVLLSEDNNTVVYAVTLSDSRTGVFIQLTPRPWRKILSSDIKIYYREDIAPADTRRGAWGGELRFLPDTWQGGEDALMILRDFPDVGGIIHGAPPSDADNLIVRRIDRFTAYGDECLAFITDNAEQAGYVILYDAYFPGWQAFVDGEPAAVYRANVMFRAVYVPAGQHTVEMLYRPFWYPSMLWLGAVVWFLWGLVLGVTFYRMHRARRAQG